jgi:hypothetical protein
LDQANDRGDNNVSLKTRLLAGAGSLALAGSLIGVAAPAAHAQPTVIGNCAGQLLLGTFFNSAALPVSLGDQTAISITAKTKLLKDKVTKTAIAGDCSSATRPGQAENPAGGLVSPLTPKAVAGKLVGNAGCATGAGIPVDATAAAAWPLNGKVTWTMTQLNALAKPWQIQADIATLGFDPLQQDVLNVGGIVLKGAAVGATVTGSFWFTPVALAVLPSNGFMNSGYDLDLASAAGCADATPGNAAINQVLVGGGGATTISPIGGIATGPIFQLGQ